ncbi:MAG: thiol-disulfide isomerase/thioredoxin [Myxococcota bacterium]|jgi:thiol-disulfide isomerase/thioredoxin
MLAVTLTLLLAAATPTTTGSLPWIVDDYDAALKQAQAKGLPIVIDLWAPWCHTCLSMKHFVLSDPSLATYKDRFVWLALDTDKPVNASVLTRFPAEVWPTFYIVAPDESVQVQKPSAMSLRGFRGFLDQGLEAMRAAKGLSADNALWWVREGDRFAAKKDYPHAATAWSTALQKGPKQWAERPGVLLKLLRALYRQKDFEAGGRLTLAELRPAMLGRDVAGVDFARYGALCADKMNDDKLKEKVRRALISPAALPHLVDDVAAPLSVDDRSDGMAILRRIYLGLEQKADADARATMQARLLDTAVSNAPSPYAAMTWGYPRLEVYSYLGRAADLIGWFGDLEVALPTQYDPPYRLAGALKAAGKFKEALAAAKRAAALAYGPRKATIERMIRGLEERAK